MVTDSVGLWAQTANSASVMRGRRSGVITATAAAAVNGWTQRVRTEN